MKNKLLKGAHLSERKCREILQLFCDDLTATQIAEISGVSRVTINNYFKLIRSRIAEYCEKNGAGAVMVDANGSFNQNVNYDNEWHAYYGFSINQNKIRTEWLKDISEDSLQQLVDIKTGGTISKMSFPEFERHHAIADCTGWNLFWVGNQQNNSLAEATFLSEIHSFWQHVKGRLLKFRGMSKKTMYLHIKECEFRYNFRNEELYPSLMNIISATENTTDFSRVYNLAL